MFFGGFQSIEIVKKIDAVRRRYGASAIDRFDLDLFVLAVVGEFSALRVQNGVSAVVERVTVQSVVSGICRRIDLRNHIRADDRLLISIDAIFRKCRRV